MADTTPSGSCFPRSLPEHTQNNQVPPSRSTLLGYRLRYAEKGVRTTLADTVRKKPVLEGWQNLATTDPRKIHREYNSRALPEYDGILTPTGAKHGRWVLDVDSPEDLERLEEQLGVPLRGISTEVRTQSGNLQIHFLWPSVGEEEIPNSVGKTPKVSDGYMNLDVRGEGGLVLLPPSAGYRFANTLPTRKAPQELVEWARGRKKKKEKPKAPREGLSGRSDRKPLRDWDTRGIPERIPAGTRHDTLAIILGGKHNGTRSLEDLIALAQEINATRCDPPIGSPGDNDDAEDVMRIARSIHGKPPCRATQRPDHDRIEELLEEASAYWYERFIGKGGKGKLRDVYRSCHIAASRRREIRRVVVDGMEREGLAFSDSCRQLAEVANTSAMSVSRHLGTLGRMGILVKGEEGAKGLASTFVLLAPAQNCYTPHNLPFFGEREAIGRGVTVSRADILATPMYGWRSPVGIVGGAVEASLEAFGSQTSEELSERLGFSCAGDLERRHLVKLLGLGVIEKVADGRWSLPLDHRERVEERMQERYSTVHRRRTRRHTDEGPGGRVVVEVEETVVDASEAERLQRLRERHSLQRARFAEWRKQEEEEAEGDDECRELLNAWDAEREAAGCIEADGFIEDLEVLHDEPREDPEVLPKEDAEEEEEPQEKVENAIRSEEEVFEVAREFFNLPPPEDPPSTPPPSTLPPMLYEDDVDVLVAICAFEERFGRGSFEWSRSGAKKLFYQIDPGQWPESDQLARLREYVGSAGGLDRVREYLHRAGVVAA